MRKGGRSYLAQLEAQHHDVDQGCARCGRSEKERRAKPRATRDDEMRPVSKGELIYKSEDDIRIRLCWFQDSGTWKVCGSCERTLTLLHQSGELLAMK